jgi:hypothetical protein
MISLAASLLIILEHVGTGLHIVAGLTFAGLVGAHLVQRRRTLRSLAGGLADTRAWRTRRARLALSDSAFMFLAANVVLSGIVDWISARPAMVALPGLRQLNWHTTSSVLLVVFAIVHIVRRRTRLRHSRIR